LQIQVHGVYPQALPKSERAKVDDFYAARDNTMPSLPWPSIAPPFTIIQAGREDGQRGITEFYLPGTDLSGGMRHEAV
ncbi:hypothetical protein, partial [Donghicola sp. XS_ASV15]|uniref:hypothetical protein n=1 Tax=Donghicola sp. XS_ASV15 TaxID=3241295 RepID=UPI003518C67D